MDYIKNTSEYFTLLEKKEAVVLLLDFLDNGFICEDQRFFCTIIDPIEKSSNNAIIENIIEEWNSYQRSSINNDPENYKAVCLDVVKNMNNNTFSIKLLDFSAAEITGDPTISSYVFDRRKIGEFLELTIEYLCDAEHQKIIS